MLNLRMAQNLKTAITFIQQGRILHYSIVVSRISFHRYVSLVYAHGNKYVCSIGLDPVSDVRVGPEIITDPAFLVTRLVYNIWFCHDWF